MPAEIAGYTASGNINVSRFVSYTPVPFVARQAVAGNPILGIAWPGSQYPVGVPTFYGASSAVESYAATNGQQLSIVGDGGNALLYINATISAGVFLKSDADGYGVAASGNTDKYGAVAVEGGFAGQLIRVTVNTGIGNPNG